MIHFQFFYYILVLVVGWSSVSGAWLAFRDSGKKGALYFTLTLMGLWLIQLELLIQLYCMIIQKDIQGLEIVKHISDTLAIALMMLSLPSLAKTSLGKEVSRQDKILLYSGITIFFLSKILYLTQYKEAFMLFGIIVLYLFIFWVFLIFFRNRKNIGDPELKTYLRVLGLFSLIALPLLMLEHFRKYIPALSGAYWIETFALPSFFLGLNLISFILGRPFYRHSSSLERGKLLEEFCIRFKLTKREREIAQLYATGKTFAQVGEELFISPRTVDKHVENI